MAVILTDACAERARVRGAFKTKKARLLGCRGVVFESIRQGRKTREEIVRAINLTTDQVGSALAGLRSMGLVIIVGQAQDIGALAFRRNSPVYDVAGAPMIEKSVRPVETRPTPTRPVAGPAYFRQLAGWGQWR